MSGPGGRVLPETKHDLIFILLLLTGPWLWLALDKLLTVAIFYWSWPPFHHEKLTVKSPLKFQKVVHHLLYIVMFIETTVGFAVLALPEVIKSWGDWNPYARTWEFDRAFLFIGLTNWTFYVYDFCMLMYGAWKDRHVPGTDKWIRMRAELIHHTFYLAAGALAFFKLSSYSVTILYMLMDVIEIPMRCVLIYYQLCTNTNLSRKLFWLQIASWNYYGYMICTALFPGLWLHKAWSSLPPFEKVLWPMLMIGWLPAQAQTAIVFRKLIARVTKQIDSDGGGDFEKGSSFKLTFCSNLPWHTSSPKAALPTACEPESSWMEVAKKVQNFSS